MRLSLFANIRDRPHERPSDFSSAGMMLEGRYRERPQRSVLVSLSPTILANRVVDREPTHRPDLMGCNGLQLRYDLSQSPGSVLGIVPIYLLHTGGERHDSQADFFQPSKPSTVFRLVLYSQGSSKLMPDTLDWQILWPEDLIAFSCQTGLFPQLRLVGHEFFATVLRPILFMIQRK
jgi:hypothetical protein